MQAGIKKPIGPLRTLQAKLSAARGERGLYVHVEPEMGGKLEVPAHCPLGYTPAQKLSQDGEVGRVTQVPICQPGSEQGPPGDKSDSGQEKVCLKESRSLLGVLGSHLACSDVCVLKCETEKHHST